MPCLRVAHNGVTLGDGMTRSVGFARPASAVAEKHRSRQRKSSRGGSELDAVYFSHYNGLG